MRVCMLAIGVVVWVAQRPVPARAQSGTDVSPAIQIHPDVPTTLQLPDEIEGVWSIGGGEVMVKGVGSKLYLRPYPGTLAGVEVFIEVKTRTLHRIFPLRVVERAEDAQREVTVQAAEATPQGGAPAIPQEVPPTTPAPAASAPASLPSALPRLQSPDADHASALARAEPVAARAVLAAGSPRFDLSVHAIMSLVGVTALEVPGYVPEKGRRSHRGFGLRIAAAPRDRCWSVEAGISGERLDVPTVHVLDLGDMESEEHRVSGTWLRADMGLRVHAGTRWRPTADVGFGLQAHLRKTEKFEIMDEQRQRLKSSEDIDYSVVLTLGMGFQYQAGDVLLGIDAQMRQGVTADYRSMEVLLSVGFFLDEENEP